MYKKCKKCKADKHFTSFHKSTTHKDGRRNECSYCTSVLKWFSSLKVNNLIFVEFKRLKFSEKHIVCSGCGIRKPAISFRKRIDAPKGIYLRCSPCINQKVDKDRKSKSDGRYYSENSDIIKTKAKHYRQKNPHKIAELSARNRAIRKRQTPNWLTEELKEEIRDKYKERKEASINGEMFHVDHIVPIKGKEVCGLHVPWNLRVIPSTQNLKKRNKLEDSE